MSSPRRGFSLLELVVALVLLGLLTSFAVPAFHRALPPARKDVSAARLAAIFRNRPQTVLDQEGGVATTFLPDGRALTVEGSGLDPLTGLVR